MLDKLTGIEDRYLELERLMSDPANMTDYSKIAEMSKERSSLEEIVEVFREYRKQLQHLDEAKKVLYDESDPDLLEMAKEELDTLSVSTGELEAKLTQLLVPKDPRDEKNVIMEIRAGAGGDEAAIFAGDLYRMYYRYALARNWKVDVTGQSEIGVGGYKYITFDVKGKGAFSRLKWESGVHRVQRVPATEAQGRIHTSTATVAVLPEMEAIEINLREDDLQEEFTLSSGAGGQNVQKNSSAVRLVHKPSGLVVEVQDQRSQLQNRQRARQILAARLYDLEMDKQRTELEGERRSQIGSGDRSEKIRTYNYPQSRVTDHRINFSSYNLPAVMDGDIDSFIDEMATRDQAERLSGAGDLGGDVGDDD